MNLNRSEKGRREPKREAEPSYAADASRFPGRYVAVVASNGSKFCRRVQQILLL